MASLDSGFDNRLQYLRTVRQQRQAEQDRLAKAPHFGAPASGFQGEGDYIKSLNDDAELAGMENEAQGKAAPRTLVNYGAPGLRAARPGIGSTSLGGDEEDPMDKGLRQGMATQEYLSRQKAIDDSADADYDQAVAASAPRGKRALDLGYTADSARKFGDIARTEGLENAREAASEFMDPRVMGARQQNNQEQERLLDVRYGKQAENQARIEAAKIAAGGKVDAAEATATGREQTGAMSALVRSRGDRSLMGGTIDPADVQSLDTNLQGAAGFGPQGIDDVSFNALVAGAGASKAGGDQLEAVWGRLTPAQQARATQALRGR